MHRLEVLRIFAEKTGSPISERAGLSGKAGSDPSLLVACGLPRFARIEDRRPHLQRKSTVCGITGVLSVWQPPERTLANYILNPSR